MAAPTELISAIQQRVEWFEGQETALGRAIAEIYRALYDDLSARLERFAMTTFRLANAEGVPVWDLQLAKQTDAEAELTNELNVMVDEAEQQVQAVLEDELPTAYLEGYMTGLWELNLAGMGLDELGPENDPDLSSEMVLGLIVAAGIAGLSFMERLQNWSETFKDKFGQWLHAQIVGERPLPETFEGLGSIASGLSGSVGGLGENELFLANTLGTNNAHLRYANFLQGEMWLTRQDILVCALCAERQGEITMEQPGYDSHNHCRCRKVPILLNPEEPMTGFRPNPLNYEEFLARRGQSA